MNQAHAVFQIKSLATDSRTFTGIATTPTPDRVGDVVDPEGAQFNLPIALLWQHDAQQPIGRVTRATVSPSGIEVTAEIANVTEPGTLKDRLDESWQSIRAGLVRGLSIGFQGLKVQPIATGMRYLAWQFLELSAVTIPCNASATIQTIKRFDSSAPLTRNRVYSLHKNKLV